MAGPDSKYLGGDWAPKTVQQSVNSNFRMDKRPRRERYNGGSTLGYRGAGGMAATREYRNSPAWKKCPLCPRDCLGDEGLDEHLETRHAEILEQ